jgi:hypothetical protein
MKRVRVQQAPPGVRPREALRGRWLTERGTLVLWGTLWLFGLVTAYSMGGIVPLVLVAGLSVALLGLARRGKLA